MSKFKKGDHVVHTTFPNAVGLIIKPEAVELTRTRIDKDPATVMKYLIKFTYDSGWSSETYMQEKYLKKIDDVSYKRFFKDHKIKTAKKPNPKHDEEEE